MDFSGYNKETNSLGEEYYSKFVPNEQTTWDQANDPWESIGTSVPWESYASRGKWIVKTPRTLRFSDDKAHKSIFKYYTTYLSFLDIAFQDPKAIIADVEFNAEGLSWEDFKEKADNRTPLGYNDARPLYPGEYTYQDAWIGIRMRVNSLENKLGFYKAKLNVDVEDVIDRGNDVEVTSTDPSNPTKILFKKFYYNPPTEIMFNITSYTVPCRVKVLEKTSGHFSIMLESLEDGSYTTGTISWLSTGY